MRSFDSTYTFTRISQRVENPYMKTLLDDINKNTCSIVCEYKFTVLFAVSLMRKSLNFNYTHACSPRKHFCLHIVFKRDEIGSVNNFFLI